MNDVEPMTPKRFSKIVEDIVKDKQVNYMDAILIYCENHELEPEDVKKRLETLLAATKGEGDDVEFLARWGYDEQQKAAIAAAVLAVAQ